MNKAKNIQDAFYKGRDYERERILEILKDQGILDERMRKTMREIKMGKRA